MSHERNGVRTAFMVLYRTDRMDGDADGPRPVLLLDGYYVLGTD